MLKTEYPTRDAVERRVQGADVVVGSVLIRGEAAPAGGDVRAERPGAHPRAAARDRRGGRGRRPARLARSARRITLHLPEGWPWQTAFDRLFTTTHAPPPAATS